MTEYYCYPTVHMRKLRLIVVKDLVQGYRTSKGRSQDSNLSPMTLGPTRLLVFLFSLIYTKEVLKVMLIQE